jgi:hypothetical protein
VRYCTLILRLFCFQKGHDMLVKYKRNRKFACYDSECLTSTGRPDPPPRLVGPFKSCGDCLMHPTALYVIAVKEIA